MKLPTITLVYDRRKVADKNRKGTVDVQVNYCGKQKFFSTGISLLPKEWNSKEKLCKGSNAVVNNKLLNSIRERLAEEVDRMLKNGIIEIDTLGSLVKGVSDNTSYLAFVEQRIPLRNVGESTRQRYKIWLDAMHKYGKIKYFNDITNAKILEFDEWLHSQKRIVEDEDGNTHEEPKYCQGTIYNYHKYLKIFIKEAIRFGYIKENPYTQYSISIDRGDKEHVDYLTLEQVHTLEKVHYVGYMERVRDLFLIQCYTGVSYSDLYKVNREQCVKTSYGLLYSNQRTKTGNIFTVLITKDAEKILNKYKWRLPEISNQKYNSYLKSLGQLINEPNLHSHQGRGAFATIALNKGISTGILQKMLGHKKSQSTIRYASVLDTTIAEQMSLMN